MYRDFVTVGLLVERLEGELSNRDGGIVDDHWIYVQDPDVLAGRLQIFNNWSPYMTWLPLRDSFGLEWNTSVRSTMSCGTGPMQKWRS